VSTDVSEEHIASVFRILIATCLLAERISSALKMEAICSSETSVDTQRTTRRYIPEDGTLHNHRCENLKSYNLIFLCHSRELFLITVVIIKQNVGQMA
jgi:hypothetical protein